MIKLSVKEMLQIVYGTESKEITDFVFFDSDSGSYLQIQKISIEVVGGENNYWCELKNINFGCSIEQPLNDKTIYLIEE